MKVRVSFFALARDLVGSSEIELELPESASVGDLRQELAARYPALAPTLARSMIAVDENYAKDADPLTDGSQVACIPPVSGG